MSGHGIECFRLLKLYHTPSVQFLAREKPLKRFRFSFIAMITWLKPGANGSFLDSSTSPHVRRTTSHAKPRVAPSAHDPGL